ncbi:alpha/beta hydrolase [Neisseriaceae bacterium JH1-16]|nr:alpha/beta hydrolase [Neisseriaceae bacterium JH1-16]
MNTPVLIVPGIGNSGPQHWQSLWQHRHPVWQRLEVPDWERPVLGDWLTALDHSITRLGPDTVVVAHSLGCLAVAHWANLRQSSLRGALLVAVPDPDSPAFPAEAGSFAPTPPHALPFASIMIGSHDDPYGSTTYSRQCAERWGSHWVSAGAAGHLNAQSGLGDWPFGQALLDTLLAPPGQLR